MRYVRWFHLTHRPCWQRTISMTTHKLFALVVPRYRSQRYIALASVICVFRFQIPKNYLPALVSYQHLKLKIKKRDKRASWTRGYLYIISGYSKKNCYMSSFFFVFFSYSKIFVIHWYIIYNTNYVHTTRTNMKNVVQNGSQNLNIKFQMQRPTISSKTVCWNCNVIMKIVTWE